MGKGKWCVAAICECMPSIHCIKYTIAYLHGDDEDNS